MPRKDTLVFNPDISPDLEHAPLSVRKPLTGLKRATEAFFLSLPVTFCEWLGSPGGAG